MLQNAKLFALSEIIFITHCRRECEWKFEKDQEPIKSFLSQYMDLPGRKYKRLKQSEIISKIMKDELYGCGIGSFSVPEELRNTKFSEHGAFVDRTTITFAQLAPQVQRLIEETKRSKADRTMVTECNQVADFFYTSDILKCWLRHGVHVDHIQSFYEFKPTTASQGFIDKITNYRRQADINPQTKQFAALWKLCGAWC